MWQIYEMNVVVLTWGGLITIDNKEVVQGENRDDEFNITEKYNILCYKYVQEYLKSNAGKELIRDNLNRAK